MDVWHQTQREHSAAFWSVRHIEGNRLKQQNRDSLRLCVSELGFEVIPSWQGVHGQDQRRITFIESLWCGLDASAGSYVGI